MIRQNSGLKDSSASDDMEQILKKVNENIRRNIDQIIKRIDHFLKLHSTSTKNQRVLLRALDKQGAWTSTSACWGITCLVRFIQGNPRPLAMGVAKWHASECSHRVCVE